MTKICILAVLLLAQPRLDRTEKTMAFAVTTWTNGVGDGDALNASNWSNGLPTVDTGTAPTDEVMAIFDGARSNTPILSGFDWVTVSGFVGDGATHWIRVLPSYTAAIGGSGNTLIFKSGTGVGSNRSLNKSVTIKGGGVIDIQHANGSFGDIIVDRPLNGVNVTVRGSWIAVFNKSGNVTIADAVGGDTTQITTTIANYGTRTHTIDAAGGGPTYIFVEGGILTTTDGATRISVSGGSATVTNVVLTASTLEVTGGVLTYLPVSDPSAQAPTVLARDGVLDLSQSPFDLQFGRFERGPNAIVLGSPVINHELGGPFSALWELDQEWP